MRLYDDRETFYQWDLNQKIKSDRFNEGDEVHFGNGKSGEALVVVAYKYGDVIVADVPNILLQKAQKIFAYQYVKDGEREYTANETAFAVFSRPKPEDYVYTETEALTVSDFVNAALLEAKESGEFDGKDGVDGKDGKDGLNGKDGKDGHTPEKYVDYFTEADIDEIANRALQLLPDNREVAY